MRCFPLLAILIALILNTQAYKGKVFDFTPAFNENDAELTMLLNIQKLEERLTHDDNVVVFPEYALTTKRVLTKEYLSKFAMEIPEVQTVLTNSNNKILKDLAVLALENELYLLVNAIEAANGKYYNTNIVLNTFGKLIAKYRKMHLNAEEKRFLTAGVERVMFQTEMGKFTTFTGEDILYEDPALTSLASDVSDVLYPTAMVAQTPFWSTLTLQDGYAKRTGANLLASSYNSPQNGTGGCGLYHGVQRKAAQVQGVEGTSALIADLDRAKTGRPECFTAESVDDSTSRALLDPAKTFELSNALLDSHTSKIHYTLPRGYKEFQTELCNTEMCCRFNATLATPIVDNDLYYKFMLFTRGQTIACGLVSCNSEDKVETCGRPIPSSKNNRFTWVRIEAEPKKKQDRYQIPATLRYDLKPVEIYEYCSTPALTTVELKQEHSIVTFGVLYTSHGSAINGCAFFIFVALFALQFRN